MNKVSKLIMLFTLIVSTLTSYALSSIDSVEKKFFILLSKHNEDATIELGDRFNASLNRFYPGFEIYNYCVGSFQNDSSNDYALSLINPISKEAIYVLLFDPDKFQIHPLLLSHFKLVMPKNSIEVGPSVQCESTTGINRLNIIIKNSNGITGEVKPSNALDNVCVKNAIGFDYESTCFSYNKKENKAVVIGGWTT